jgi:hypothetical protein
MLATLEPGVATVRTEKAVANNNDRANRGLGNFLTVAGVRPRRTTTALTASASTITRMARRPAY